MTSTTAATQVAPSVIASPHFSLSTTCINLLETKEDQKINTIIIFSAIVADHVIPTVDMYKDDPAKLWLTLKQQFQLGALERQLALKNQLHYTRMKEGQTVEESIRKINTHVSELAKSNYQIDQKCLINTVLHGLPHPRWETFIENFGLYMRRNPSVQLSELVEELQAVELSRKVLHQFEDVAMLTMPTASPANFSRTSPNRNSTSTQGRYARG